MHPALLKFLSTFDTLDKAEVEAIAMHIPYEEFPKGTVLQAPGQVPNRCYFVLEGLVRQYFVIEGNEKTTAFFTESQGSCPANHFVDRSPSAYYLVCAEDCLLIYGDHNIDQANFERFPVLKEIVSQMVEAELNQTRDEFSKFITSSSEQRYLHFLKTRPDLQNRVPQHQVASLLGLTPESLSRLRKRLVTKG